MIPKTFSAPGSTYRPTVAECLRDGVWLMLRADDLNRKTYSYDDADPAKGVRISCGTAHVDPAEGMITVPQQIVYIALSSLRFDFKVNTDGQERIVIAVQHLEAPDTSTIDVDVSAPAKTAETLLGRVREILMRGTIYAADVTTNNGGVIDPHNSPLLEDGTYDIAQWRQLNTLAPDVTYARPIPIRRKVEPDEAELFGPFALKDFAIGYTLFASYVVDIADREVLTLGGQSDG